MVFYWLLIALLLLLVEMGNPGLFLFLSFSCGAVIAALISGFGYSITTQIAALLLGSIFSFIVLRYWLKAKLTRKSSEHDSNIYALISKQGVVIKKITSDYFGQVQLDGQVWSARSIDNTSIDVNKHIVVVAVKGAHVVVKEV